MSYLIDKIAIFIAVLLACAPVAFAADASLAGQEIVLESPVIKTGDPLPVDQTQHGWDYSPPLTWKNLPKGTKSLALIFEGPVNAKPRPFVHWVVYNIPPTAKGLPQDLPREARIEDAKIKAPKELAGVVQGHTGWGDPGYRGPWPVKGPERRYRFKLYALDAKLNLKPGLNKQGLLKAIKGHVIGTVELVVVAKPYGFS